MRFIVLNNSLTHVSEPRGASQVGVRGSGSSLWGWVWEYQYQAAVQRHPWLLGNWVYGGGGNVGQVWVLKATTHCALSRGSCPFLHPSTCLLPSALLSSLSVLRQWLHCGDKCWETVASGALFYASDRQWCSWSWLCESSSASGPGSLNQLHQATTSHTTAFHLWVELVKRLGGIMVGEWKVLWTRAGMCVEGKGVQVCIDQQISWFFRTSTKPSRSSNWSSGWKEGGCAGRSWEVPGNLRGWIPTFPALGLWGTLNSAELHPRTAAPADLGGPLQPKKQCFSMKMLKMSLLLTPPICYVHS